MDYEPKHIIQAYLSKRMIKRSLLWKYDDKDSRNKSKRNTDLANRPKTRFSLSTIEEIIENLDKCSDDFSDFIKGNKFREEQFEKMVSEMINNFEYKSLKDLANELFREQINWNLIISLLVFGSECACKILSIDGLSYVIPIEMARSMISDLSDWLTSYIVVFLEPWILEQNDGWLSIKSQFGFSEKNVEKQVIDSPHLFGRTTIICLAIIIFGLYLGSKS